jgi:predicted Zn-dependent protease
MAVLTIEEAQADLARVAGQVAEARVRALEDEIRAAEERLRAAEAQRLQALRSIGESIRQLDELIARITPSDAGWKRLLAEAQELRADLYCTIKEQVPDEAWFWTEGWQASEREADAQIAAGEGTAFADDEAFLSHLRALRPDVADL